MTLVEVSKTPAGIPQPLLIYSGDLAVQKGPGDKRQRYPIEIWEVANGSKYAIVTDVRGNTSLMNSSESIAEVIRGRWTGITAIIEHWPGGIGPDGATFVISSETGGNFPLDLTEMAQVQGLVLPS